MNTSKGIGKFFSRKRNVVLLCVFLVLAALIIWFVWPKSVSDIEWIRSDRITSISVINQCQGVVTFEITDPEDVKQFMEAINRPRYQPHHLSMGIGSDVLVNFRVDGESVGGVDFKRDGQIVGMGKIPFLYYKTSDYLWDDPIFEKYGLPVYVENE